MQLPKPAAAPSTGNAPPSAPPAPPPHVTVDDPRRRWPWIAGLLAIAAIGGFLWQRTQQKQEAARAASSGIRTFTVRGGALRQTLRLAGTTGAEKFSSLLTPQLRGSRSGYSRDGSSGYRSSSQGARSSSSGGGSSSSASGSSSGSASAIPAAGGGASGSGGGGGTSAAAAGQNASAGGAGSSSLSQAMRSSTSRVGGSTSSRSSSSRSSSPSQVASATMGADGVGSTANNLPGGGGGGGGSTGGGGGGGTSGRGGGGGGTSEFMLVLQDAAKPGSLVKKGDKVAEFDRQYMLTRLDDYRSSVTQSEAAFKKMLAEIEVTKKAHEQTIANAVAAVEKARLDMKTVPVMSAIQSERLRLTLEEAEARLKQLREEVRHVEAGLRADRRVAELDLQQTKLELRRAEMNANRMEMKSPIEGLVVMQNMFRGGEFDAIRVGDQLYPGMMFMQIVDPSSMVINANVNQSDVEKMRIGQKATVRFDAFPDLVLPAHIYGVGAVAKASRSRPDWVKEMGVMLKLDAMDRRVIPDLSVSCDVLLESADAPAIVPREAIFSEAGAKETKPYVLVRAVDGSWTQRQVEVGSANNVEISVRSGLKDGDVIALDRPDSGEPKAKAEQVSYSNYDGVQRWALNGRRRERQVN